jgi:hypothetical protein
VGGPAWKHPLANILIENTVKIFDDSYNHVYFYSYQTLIVLELSSNQIHDQGVESLATVMEKNIVNSDLY